MKTAIAIAIVFITTAAAITVRSFSHDRTEHRILYYRDPMHPAYRSDKPGVAPDCGMALEPVYDDDGSAARPEDPSRDNVNISAHIQHLVGIGTEEVRSESGEFTLRLLGRVAADETRMFRVNAASAGWIQEVKPITTGTIVHKGERLADFYTPEFLSAEQAFLFALRSLDRFQEDKKESADQIALTQANVQQYADALRSLGMADLQLENLRQTRQLTQHIWMTATGNRHGAVAQYFGRAAFRPRHRILSNRGYPSRLGHCGPSRE